MVGLLAEAGVSTVAVARRDDRLQALADRFTDVEVLVADLATDDGQAPSSTASTDAERPIDLVVNNAGFGTSGAFHELDPDRLAERDRAQRGGADTALARRAGGDGAAWPRLAAQRASVASFQPAPELAVYAATKAYVTSLSESLHEEARGTGVHVTALCPGLTRTEFQQVSNTAALQPRRFPAVAWTSVETGGAHRARRRRRRQGALACPALQYKAISACRRRDAALDHAALRHHRASSATDRQTVTCSRWR